MHHRIGAAADCWIGDLNLPPISEQRRIAEILHTLAEQIRKTEQIIAKLRLVHQGLLADLLTRGIDDGGNIRDPMAFPGLFKETVLGKLPRAWRVQTLGVLVQENSGVIQTGPFGSQLYARDYRAVGVPVVMPQDIVDDVIDTSDIARIGDKKARELSRHRLRLNDVVVARRGDLTRASAITEREVDWICGTGCLLVRLPSGACRASWLTALYQHELGQAQVRAQAVGSTMPNLSGQILARLLLAFPPIAEQDRIAVALSSHLGRLRAEVAQLRKLQLLKQALRADLLTGRVQVFAMSA